jgi:hypothetical protein
MTPTIPRLPSLSLLSSRTVFDGWVSPSPTRVRCLRRQALAGGLVWRRGWCARCASGGGLGRVDRSSHTGCPPRRHRIDFAEYWSGAAASREASITRVGTRMKRFKARLGGPPRSGAHQARWRGVYMAPPPPKAETGSKIMISTAVVRPVGGVGNAAVLRSRTGEALSKGLWAISWRERAARTP